MSSFLGVGITVCTALAQICNNRTVVVQAPFFYWLAYGIIAVDIDDDDDND
jgi:hypothetical protein